MLIQTVKSEAPNKGFLANALNAVSVYLHGVLLKWKKAGAWRELILGCTLNLFIYSVILGELESSRIYLGFFKSISRKAY